jgi:hypothetical protein
MKPAGWDVAIRSCRATWSSIAKYAVSPGATACHRRGDELMTRWGILNWATMSWVRNENQKMTGSR